MKEVEELNNEAPPIIGIISKRIVLGALSQIIVENIDKLEITDPHWRQVTRQTANRLRGNLDKELNLLLGNQASDKQFWKAAKLFEDDTKASFEHIVKEITKVIFEGKENDNTGDKTQLK